MKKFLILLLIIFLFPVEAIAVTTDQIENENLYSFEKPTLKDATLSLIPYFAWANRGETDMRVWFSCKI
jgi:DUF1680 family protein